MQVMRIPLYKDRNDVYVDAYIAGQLACREGMKRRAMLVIPGGGYEFCSDREAEPIAKAFMAQGMNAFVLTYSIGKRAHFPQPMLDASMAMHILRSRAEEFHIDPDCITVCGFSAGGHLAASMATLWHRPEHYEPLGMPYGENRPNGAILCYPVITAGDKAHRGSFDALLGDKASSQELLDAYSLEKHVDERSVPAFLWHTASDPGVPVENSLYMASAYAAAGVPFELHVFPEGPHGLSLATRETADDPAGIGVNPHCAQWVKLAVRWMDEVLYK